MSDFPVLSPPTLLYLCHSALTPRFRLMSYIAPRPPVQLLFVSEVESVVEKPGTFPVADTSVFARYTPSLPYNENLSATGNAPIPTNSHAFGLALASTDIPEIAPLA